MKLSKKQSGNFTPADEGTFRGVIVDITPLVKRETQYGVKDEFRIVFEIDAPEREDGSRQCVWSRGFAPSLNEKANLRKFLRQLRGRDLTVQEEEEFDLEAMIGSPANIVIVHEEGKNGETYANIAAATPYRGNDPLLPSGKFTRKKDREEKADGAGESSSYRNAAKPEDPTPKGDAVDATQAGGDWSKVKVHVGKHSGVELRDLDPDAIEKLSTNWMPIAESNAKSTADDKRLVKALKAAREFLATAVAGAAAEY
jgi:hypothetical protein